MSHWPDIEDDVCVPEFIKRHREVCAEQADPTPWTVAEFDPEELWKAKPGTGFSRHASGAWCGYLGYRVLACVSATALERLQLSFGFPPPVPERTTLRERLETARMRGGDWLLVIGESLEVVKAFRIGGQG